MQQIRIVWLSIALVAVIVLLLSLAKVTYHLSKSVLSIKKNRRTTAYRLGLFAFFRPELFEEWAQPHVRETARWSVAMVIALVLVLMTYPFPR